MKSIITTILGFCLLPLVNGQASTGTGNPSGTVQPKIMVIPFTKEGEDIRTVLEDDVNKRIAITKIKEAFDNRGFTTVDFTAKLKAAKENLLLSSDNQTDWKTQIIAMSGADIYVQAEVDITTGAEYNVDCRGYKSKVKIILTGYESSSGNSLSNKVGESKWHCTIDMGRLASDAVEGIAEDFLNTMQMKFTEIVENGVEMILDFSLSQEATYNFDDEFPPDDLPLRYIIDDWVAEKAYKNNYHPGTSYGLKLSCSLRQPLKHPETGRNFNVRDLSRDIYTFLRSLGIKSSSIEKGNTIIITLKERQ